MFYGDLHKILFFDCFYFFASISVFASCNASKFQNNCICASFKNKPPLNKHIEAYLYKKGLFQSLIF